MTDSADISTTSDRKPVVQITGLHKSFGSNHVLRGFNLTIHEGEQVAVLGQSGSGKSVLIKCIVGLIKPDSGEISVFGKDIPDQNREELDRIREKIGFLFQSNALYDSMTVRENLEFPLRRLRIKESIEESENRIRLALESVGLLHTLDLMPSELSGGMRKRIGLARTLIMNPKIILYDEPTTGLDPVTAKEIARLMNNVHKSYNTSSIIISHDLHTIKLTAHRIVVLMEGINYAEGTYEELAVSDDPRINAFFK